MKILAIVILIIVGLLVDAAVAFLLTMGVPTVFTYIVPVLVWGTALELFSARHKEHSFLVKLLRTVGLGIVFCVILSLNIPWILKPLLLIVLIVGSAIT